MIAVIQTVKDASCTVEKRLISQMTSGLLVFFCVEKGDKKELVKPFIEKILRLRLYRGEEDNKTNYSIMDRSKCVMIISQFTLASDLNRGNRPSFDNAEKSEIAKELYLEAIKVLEENNVSVSRGAFGEHMEIKYINDGPETFILKK